MTIENSKPRQNVVEWLKLLLAAVSIVSLVIIYLLLPATPGVRPTFELLKNLIPGAIVTLLVFPVVYFVLNRAGLSFEQKVEMLLEESEAALPTRFKGDVYDTAELVKNIVSHKSVQRNVHIEILAFTGATFVTALLRDLISSYPGKLTVCMRRIDFDRVDKNLLPVHWPQEAAETELRLKVLSPQTIRTEVWKYPTLPFMLGLQIDQSDLLLCFPRWDNETGRIADKGNEYFYFKQGPKSEHFFNLFHNWATQPGQLLTLEEKHGGR